MGKAGPEEIHKDILNFQEYMQKKYKGQLEMAVSPAYDASVIGGGEKEIEEEAKEIKFDIKPEELESYLDRYVVKQEMAKEVLATKVCTHFNRIKLEGKEEVGRIKNNILMIGPSGVGKTYIIKLIADKIGVPFVKADATKFSETGYVGGDVEDLIRDLAQEAKGNIRLAEYGIIYLDEVDKLAARYSSIGPDVSRTGVQRALLKLMEETEVDLRSPFDPAALMESAMQIRRGGKIKREKINTKNILFICSGAFSGLEEIIKKRLNETKIGFNTPLPREEVGYLKEIKYEDLIEYGFESEFIARLPVVAIFKELGVEDLYAILKNPISPIILGKKRDFKSYGIEVGFEEEALHKLAELAYQEKTGARGLVSAVEKALLKYENRLPSTGIGKFRVSKKVVENPERELKKLLFKESKSKVREYQSCFFDKYGVKINFTATALDLLTERATKANDTYSFCKGLLEDYGLGLKLVNKKTFTVTREVLKNPKDYLDRLIKNSYKRRV